MEPATSTQPPKTPAEDWISRQQLAQLLGVSRQTVYRLAKNGQLTCFEHGSPVAGKHCRYSRYLVERHLQINLKEAMGRSPVQ